MPRAPNDSGFKEIFDLVYRIFKLDCWAYNESYMRRRINARIMANNLAPDDYGAYAKLLAVNLEEQRRLYNALTINVTQFFRDTKLWDAIRNDVIPKLIEEKRAAGDRFIQIWSCGCSSGEEPYSIALLFKEVLGERRDIVPMITGTDIDDYSLERAHKAVYDANVFRSMPREFLYKYFKPVTVKNTEKFELFPSVKSLVQIKQHNFLLDPPPARNLDMIFCRNVIIYFNPAAKDKLMNVFYESLAENGLMVLGKSEVLFTVKMQQHFYLHNVEERIYRKERRKKQVKFDFERRKNWWLGYDKKE